MGKTIVTVLILAMIYVLARMFTSGITVESDVYGYYKDGKLNRRGIVSLVQDIKRRIPIKTTDTTVVGVTYNYEDTSPPRGQINYYHRIDPDKVDFYLSHRQQVVNHMATVQCANSEVVAMLEKLERITISFYRGSEFLFGMEVSAELCASGENSREAPAPSGDQDGSEPEPGTGAEPAGSPEKAPEKGDPPQGAPAAAGDDRGSKAGDAHDTPDGEGGDAPEGARVSRKDDPVARHVAMLSPKLPIKTSFGSLIRVEAEGRDGVRHSFDVDGDRLGGFASMKGRILEAYCANAHLASLLSQVDHVTLDFSSGGHGFARWKVTRADCAARGGK